MAMRCLRLSAPIPFLLAAAPALAHGGASHGFGAGLAHPLLGLDHLVAMVAIGIWAALAGLPRAWMLPGAFLGGMAAGIALGLAVAPPAGTELLVSGSIVLLGIAVGVAGPARAGLALPLAAAIGAVHGIAHGGEIGGSPAVTALGMLAGTAILLALGYLAGRAAVGRMALARAGGAGIVAAGLALVVLG